MREKPDTSVQVLNGEKITGNTEDKGVKELLKEMESVLLGARKTVGGEANNVTNSPPQEEIKEGRKDEGDMDVIEEASLLKEDEELLLKAAVFMQLLEAEKEKNKELEGKVAEMEENEVTLRALTKLCQKDVDIMEGRVERSERKEKELKAQVLELIREF